MTPSAKQRSSCRGHPPDLSPAWEVLQPDLDLIVLAYLAHEPDEAPVEYVRTPSRGKGGAS